MKVYIIETGYGKVSIAEVVVEPKEKTYKVISSELIYGNHVYVGKIIKKQDAFETAKGAALAAEKWLSDYIEVRKEELQRAENNLRTLQSAIGINTVKNISA